MLQLVVVRKPLLVLSDSEYSPRVVALFREVRKKALPAAAQRLYSVPELTTRTRTTTRPSKASSLPCT